jgi:hypothetical protein
LQIREVFNDLSGFETDGDDLPYQTQNILRVIVPIGIVGDAAAFVGGDLILIDDPFWASIVCLRFLAERLSANGRGFSQGRAKRAEGKP